MKKHWSNLNWFDWQKVQRLLGVQFASLALAFSIVSGYPTHAFDYGQTPNMTLDTSTEVVTTTFNTFVFPLAKTLGMSQGYHGLHPGVDLRAPKGTSIYTMADGVVIQVEKIWGGYGHYVRIAHQGTLSSLYAHLDEVVVKPGDKVKAGTKIGTVGMTGWTTGPHLHLEVSLADKSVNPLSYIGSLPKKLAQN